ncbi:serine/threonine-protein kinase D2, partial [Clarias magur]
MANSSPVIPSTPQSQVFFASGVFSPHGSMEPQHATPVSLPAIYTSGSPVVDTGLSQGSCGTNVAVMPPPQAGVSFIIQIGLTRESVLLPQTADLTYVKQIACSIVDQK